MLPYQQQYQGNYTAFQGGSYQPQPQPQPQPQYQNFGQPLPEVYIELNTKQKAGVRNLVSPKEKIFYAGVVPKINQGGKVQERILVITNKTVYNIDPNEGFFSGLALCSTPTFTVKRKIDINRINAITVSVNPTSEQQQFVIHVRGGHDYRYKGLKNRERIVKSFFNAHFANTLEPLVLFCREEIELAKFQTSEEDVKAKKSKRPQGEHILVTPENAAKGLEWMIFNRRFLASMTNARYSGPQQFNQYPQSPMNGGFNNSPGPYGHQNQGPSFPQQGGHPVGGYGAPHQGGQFDPRYSHPSNQRPSTNYNKPQYYVPEFQPQQINTQVPQGYQQEKRPSTPNENYQGYNNSNYPQQAQPVQPTQPINNNISPQFKGLEAFGNPNQNVQINSFAGQGPQNNYPHGNQNNTGNYGYNPRY